MNQRKGRYDRAFQKYYGSRRLKLRPLHPFVGLAATAATSTATAVTHTALK